MMQDSKKIKEISKLSFEEALERLENTVRSMESGEIKLEDMIAKFEEGRVLASLCQKKLDTLKQKVELLTKDDSGNMNWEEINTEGIAESKNDFISSSADEDTGSPDLPF